MNTITFTDSSNIYFNIGEVIQENDINNVILAYNYSQTPYDTYSITDVSSINLLSTIYEIGINAFNGFTSMSSITLSSTIHKINIDAFKGCSALQSIVLPDVLTTLGNNAFYGCTSLTNVILNNTNNLVCIGDAVFTGVTSTGTYTFGSDNNLARPTILNLISLLPAAWSRIPEISYNIYVDFAILYDTCSIENKTFYVDLSCVPITYKDFHTLFFNKNNFFSLNCSVITQPNVINPVILDSYITLNKQVDIYGNKFNLMSTLDGLYECSMPKKVWSVESVIYFNKHIGKLKTILNFNIDNRVTICRKKNECNKNECNKNECNKNECNKNECNKNECNKNECNKNECNNQLKSCNILYNKNNIQKIYTRGPSIITIDDFFNMFEAQGVEMALDNSFNSVPIKASGLPINAATTKYVAILNLFVKSMYKSVDNLNIKLPYLIDFTGSMPTSSTDNNNYRYNP
jgi:hypothetical protein